MFNDSHSFYFSYEGDLTHTQQRKLDLNAGNTDGAVPFWQTVSGSASVGESVILCIH